jgi:uncharacterized damage-inducible protein DinB
VATSPTRDRRLEMTEGLFEPPAGAKLWHGGASVFGALRGVKPEEAAWKPAPDRHSIWDLTLHVAYYNYVIWRRVTGSPEGGFPRSPAHFPKPADEITPATWKDDRALVREYHDRVHEAMLGFDSSRLDDPWSDKSDYTFADLFMGIVLHDTYHAGQIQMVKRLYASIVGK